MHHRAVDDACAYIRRQLSTLEQNLIDYRAGRSADYAGMRRAGRAIRDAATELDGIIPPMST